MLPTPEELYQLLRYDAEMGLLYWRPRRAGLMAGDGRHTPESFAEKWNARYAGREALTCIGNHGYRYGRVLRHTVLAHRAIWAIVSGAWPVSEIDHINGDRLDNRIDNLREVTTATNALNRQVHSNNTSGVSGVFWIKPNRRWQAYINHNGKRTTLGCYATFDEAVAVRKSAEKRLGFHPNNGRAPR